MRPHQLSVGGNDHQVQGATLRLILQAARDAQSLPQLRELVIPVVADFHPNDDAGRAAAIFEWVRENFRWVPDPLEHEWVQGVEYTLKVGAGDCDDLSALLLGAWASVAIDGGLVACGPHPGEPFQHVYPAALLDGRWVPGDPSVPELRFGEQIDAGRREVFPLTGETDAHAASLWTAARAAAQVGGPMPQGGNDKPKGGRGRNQAGTEPCSLPPGREWHILNCLPVVPRPQWEKYLRTGRWNQGIQKGLDQTAECLTNEAVVVSGEVITVGHGLVRGDGLPALPFDGVLPPGWYRHCVGPDPEPEVPEVPPDEEVPVEVEEPPQVEVPPTYERPPDGWDSPLERGELPGGVTELMPIGCQVEAAPTVELLLPLNMNNGFARFAEGHRWCLTGELGSWVLRIPGSDHPLFGTGLAIGYIAREYLSELGHELFDYWDRCRLNWCDPKHFGRGRESCFVMPWCSREVGGAEVQVRWWTSPYFATHMQCPRNHYPAFDRMRGASMVYPVAEELKAAPVRWRWERGWTRPAESNGQFYDRYLEKHLKPVGRQRVRYTSQGPGVPMLREVSCWEGSVCQYDLSTSAFGAGSPYDYDETGFWRRHYDAPEMAGALERDQAEGRISQDPLDFAMPKLRGWTPDCWDTVTRTVTRHGWAGDPPGTYLVGGVRDDLVAIGQENSALESGYMYGGGA